MKRKPQLGFLGVGWIGRHRMQRIAESDVAEIAVICDPSEVMLDQARFCVPDAECVETYDELLDHDLDGVVIATPSAVHAEQSIRALKQGLAVFCQKPLGRTAAEAGEVIQTAKSVNRLLHVDLSYRYTEAIQKIREVIQTGELGPIYAADLVFHNAYGPDKSWFYDPKLSGGGCVMDLGVHLVDLALWLLDFPKIDFVFGKTYAAGLPLGANPDRVEDFATARMDLENGATIQLACSWKLPAGSEAVISATFYGPLGAVSMRNINGSFYDFTAERYQGTQRRTLSLPPDSWGGRAAVAWASRLVDNPEFDPSVEHLKTVSQVLDSIYGRPGSAFMRSKWTSPGPSRITLTEAGSITSL